jgi:hypothetical protein
MIHKHAVEIIAWAGGAEIQIYVSEGGEWVDICNPIWLGSSKFRIKPEPKPDVMVQFHAVDYSVYSAMYFDRIPNLKLTFDGETGELKAAEVLK